MDAPPSAEPLAIDLAELGRADLARAGGKGANLGELIRGGFPVPPGFVITCQAYRAAVAALGAPERLESGRLPEPLWREIAARYQRLGGGAVAVRSSATAEDLPGATFAGQHATLLEISGEEALERAVRECWASLQAERAVAYRARQGASGEVAMAVVVQRMVQPACAGVMFTADPISSDRGVVCIEAAPGLGEAVVGGTVTPERVVVDRARSAVLERRAGQFGGAPVLPDEQARQLALLAIAVERHFGGAPQDIEWAIAEGRCFLLQARPMTALRPAGKGRARPPQRRGGPKEIARQISGELFPVRPYPLDLTTHTSMTMDAVFQNLFHPIGARVRPAEQTLVHEDGVVLRLEGFGPRPSWRMLYRPFLSAWRARRHPLERWASDPIIAEGLERARRLRARELTALDWAGVLGTLDEALSLTGHMARLRGRYFPKALLWLLLYWGLLLVGRRLQAREALGAGIETKTLELNRELEAMAALVREDPALREAFRTSSAPELWRRLRAGELSPELGRRFEAFLDRFGNRETFITLASHPSWWNAPEIPLSVVQGLASGEPPSRPEGSPPAWEKARDEALAGSILGRWPLRRLFLRALSARRLAYQLREDTHFYITAGQPVVHACFKELGRRLAEAGVLEHQDDVFHLLAPELREAWPPSEERARALRAAVERRKKKREALGAWVPAAKAEASADDGALVSGLPGSPGTAEGPVRVISGPEQFGELRSGEVLVCPYTNPSWTPLFHRAAAVVADWGGANSHAAIVAREYGIPAVMGTGDGSACLLTGQRVRVDGTTGRVYRAEDARHGR